MKKAAAAAPAPKKAMKAMKAKKAQKSTTELRMKGLFRFLTTVIELALAFQDLYMDSKWCDGWD